VVGVRPAFELRFYDSDGDLVDPASITVRSKDPSGDITQWVSPDATISQIGTGIWEFQYPAALTEAGRYWLYVVGSGGGADAASEISFTVRGSHVPAP
jgi:hypothetical protein